MIWPIPDNQFSLFSLMAEGDFHRIVHILTLLVYLHSNICMIVDNLHNLSHLLTILFISSILRDWNLVAGTLPNKTFCNLDGYFIVWEPPIFLFLFDYRIHLFFLSRIIFQLFCFFFLNTTCIYNNYNFYKRI